MTTQVYHLTTRTGHTLRVRPLRDTDTQHLVTLYDRLSIRSRYQRFTNLSEQVEPQQVWQIAADIAHTALPQGFGLLAFGDLPGEPHTPVAVVRYRLSPPDEAEVSISVRDEFQGQGVGAALILLIRDYARQHGIRRIFGLMPAESRFLTYLARQGLPDTTIVPQGKMTYISVPV